MSVAGTFPRPVQAVLRWRPLLPERAIIWFLLRSKRGVVTEPDGTIRPLDFSARRIMKTRREMEQMQRLADPQPVAMRRRRVELPRCTAEQLRLPESRDGHVLLYLHGGGYLRGSTDTHIGAISRLMRAARVEAMSVDYRLAPEHTVLDAVDDALSGYRHLLERGVEPNRIAVAGDSAGGGLALLLTARLAEEQLPQPSSVAVVSPWADLSCAGPSHDENADSDAMFGSGMIPETARWLAGQLETTPDDPRLSPAFAHYVGAPPLRIHVSRTELLYSDAVALADRYRADGGTVELREHPSAPHAWIAIGSLKAARTTAREIGTFIAGHMRG